MAKGERTFDSSKTEKKKFNFAPFAAGDYDLKLRGDKAEIKKKATDPNAFPYVSVAFEALGTAEDGGKNRLTWHMFFLRMKPGKDGSVMPQRADQLKGLADALATPIKADIIQVHGEDCVSAKQVVEWLKSNDGTVVRGHVKVQAGSKDYPEPKNVISEFFEAAEGSGPNDEEEEDLDDEEDTDEEEDLDEEDEDEDADDESDEDEDDLDKAAKKGAKKAPVKAGKKGKR